MVTEVLYHINQVNAIAFVDIEITDMVNFIVDSVERPFEHICARATDQNVST
ncbi:Uncharacterised protein [Vibrio cholerae]|nr:Uncharacterised protein [Vibrio cholerae]